jgi:hypothetical protein
MMRHKNVDICDFCNNLLQRELHWTLDDIIESPQLFRGGKQIRHLGLCPDYSESFLQKLGRRIGWVR